MLVELSKSQDIEAGDGTTSVCVIAGALLNACSDLLAKGIHPMAVAESFLAAAEKAEEILEGMSTAVDLTNRCVFVDVCTFNTAARYCCIATQCSCDAHCRRKSCTCLSRRARYICRGERCCAFALALVCIFFCYSLEGGSLIFRCGVSDGIRLLSCLLQLQHGARA